MDQKKLTEEEYEAQFYEDFTSSSFMLILKKIVEENASAEFAKFEEHMKNAADEQTVKDLVVSDFTRARELFAKYLKIHLDKIQPVVKDFLSIPENVVFKCDELNEGFVDKIETLKAECTELEHKLTQQKVYSILLMEECKKLTQLMPLVDKIRDVMQDPDIQDLKECTLLETAENRENQPPKPLWNLLKHKRNAWKYSKQKENLN